MRASSNIFAAKNLSSQEKAMELLSICDEHGQSQLKNERICHDNALSFQPWTSAKRQERCVHLRYYASNKRTDLLHVTAMLTQRQQEREMRGLVKVQIISKGPGSHRFCSSDHAYFCLLYEWLKKNLITRRSATSFPLLLGPREPSRRRPWKRGQIKPLQVRQTNKKIVGALCSRLNAIRFASIVVFLHSSSVRDFFHFILFNFAMVSKGTIKMPKTTWLSYLIYDYSS